MVIKFEFYMKSSSSLNEELSKALLLLQFFKVRWKMRVLDFACK